ncbi:serine/threonine phosphatase [Chamaesiphon minutus]|uniref:Serine/threonine protein phosphatase n=1 Tax=Chamaesiphon minutus (strain ATCC 27169 / PCC 6605) TaxID=1173020 RepID=K9UMP7_CHAP6|nr:serine/threonine phosphatase [Chamaesiphon minutus]AFY95469.1 serine/threonine protein phosphatase [Chamaesiphon minutus PCC 6605]
MLICPYCHSVNPQHHNFCQDCGRSLKHYACKSCGNNVEFDAESCSQCQATSGTYWWAIIEPTADENIEPPQTPAPAVAEVRANDTADAVCSNTEELYPLSVARESSTDYLDSEQYPNPWDSPTPPTATLVQPTGSAGPANDLADSLSVPLSINDDLTISPWDTTDSPPDPSNNNGVSPAIPSPGDGPNDPALINSQPLVPTTYLGPQCQYRLLDPVVIQLLKPNDSSQVRVIDRQPFCNSLLEILMEQEPVTIDSMTADAANQAVDGVAIAPIATRSPEIYRQWQFWNSHGIPKVAQAYIALQVSLPGTIPTIRDSWKNDGKTVTIVEDRSTWPQLIDNWNEPHIPSSQRIYWLDSTLKLWVALEPWQMRQSLLEVANLLLDEDGRICFGRLYPEPTDRQLQLADLAQMWKVLFDRFNLADANQLHSLSLVNLLQAIHSGEIERVEEVRARLGQIAYELEPKQLSAPLQPPSSADLSSPQDAPTMALALNLLDLEQAAATHTGKKRDHNEDCYGIVSRIDRQDTPKGRSITARGLYILCDGMGGHAGGEIASSMTVDILRDYFATCWHEDTLPDELTIREGIVAANEAVFDINQKNAAQGSGRMGTTLVLVLVQDRNIAVAHVGDSRCYGITPTQGLIQLTLDHEVGQQQILRGVDPDIAYGRPDSYQLTQAIGPRDRNYIAPDIRFFELQEDTLIVLASDGLTDNQLLENYWLTNVAPLLSTDSNLQAGVDRLIDFANEYNGHDNITALIVRAKLG